MGYTHYYQYPLEDPAWKEGFGRLALDALEVAEAGEGLGIALAGYDEAVGDFSRGAPVATEGAIALNGWGLAHGSLVIVADPMAEYERPEWQKGHWRAVAHYHRRDYERRGRRHWAFCKTARKPYDLAVATILLRGAALMPGVSEIASDGGWDGEWACGVGGGPVGARALCLELFGPLPEGVGLGMGGEP